MTPVAWVAMALAFAIAVEDWTAVASEKRRVEYLCKPLTMVMLIGAALALDPHDSATRAWFVIALLCSLAGDIFLMLERDLFVPGLASFLLAHIAYVVGMLVDGVAAPGVLIGVVVVTILLALIGRRIVDGVRRTEPALTIPVVAYMGVISAMVVAACGVGRIPLVVGAGLFYGSDALIGWSRFVGAARWMPLAIIITYHLGQLGLVLSLADSVLALT